MSGGRSPLLADLTRRDRAALGEKKSTTFSAPTRQRQNRARIACTALNLFRQQIDTNCPFQFQKCCQDFFGTHNEALSIVAMCVGNPDCSPLTIHG
jgi:hypothetical protein